MNINKKTKKVVFFVTLLKPETFASRPLGLTLKHLSNISSVPGVKRKTCYGRRKGLLKALVKKTKLQQACKEKRRNKQVFPLHYFLCLLLWELCMVLSSCLCMCGS